MYEPTSRKERAGSLAELDSCGEHPPELGPGLAELDRGGEHPPELDPRLEELDCGGEHTPELDHGLAHPHTKYTALLTNSIRKICNLVVTPT